MQDTSQTAEGTPDQASPEASDRQSKYQHPAIQCCVGATALLAELGWHVSLEIGAPDTGQTVRYMTVSQARALAASLIAAADHHDAETARLAGA